MKKALITLTLSIAVLSLSCTKIKKELEQDEVKGKTITSIQHPMYNGKATLDLDPKYGRFDLDELAQLVKALPENSFVANIYNYKQIDLLKSSERQFYVFIDTTTNEEIIQFERLDKRIDINPDRASSIGVMFMKSLQQATGMPDAEVDIEEAKYGAQKFFKFAYFKMNIGANNNVVHSNQFVITSRASSYSMYTLGPSDVDHYNLQNKIKFNE